MSVAEKDEPGVDITYERDEDKVVVKVKYGDASIKVKSISEQGGEDLALLVQNLPQILTYAFDAMDEADPQEEA